MNYQVLDDKQVDEFVDRGYICLRKGVPKDFMDEATSTLWVRLGYDAHDPATWSEDFFGMPRQRSWMPEEAAPTVWGAACDLAGGPDRVADGKWSDSFIPNFGRSTDKPYEAMTPTSAGWHLDGDEFRRYLDSPDLVLRIFSLFSDTPAKGGPTVILPESVGLISRYLNEHRDGPLSAQIDQKSIAAQCREVVELTGEAGDVFLVHPFMLHASSPNILEIARILHTESVKLRQPMRFDRDDPADFSPLERSILHAVGVDRLDYTPEGPRQVIRNHNAKRRAYIRAERKRMEDLRLRTAAISAANAFQGYR